MSLRSRSGFVGNITALTSITLDTTASLNGSALARNGAVTLDDNVISKTPCATTTTTTPGTTTLEPRRLRRR